MPNSKLVSPDGLLTYFSHIFANSKDMINLFSLSRQKIILWNEAGTASMGYTMEDFEKIPLDQLYPPEDFSKLMKTMETLATTGYAFEKLHMYAKNGELKDLWTRAFIIQKEPEVICLVHTIDITDEKKREDKAVREAKLATLGEAAAVLSHELSNSLQAIEFNINLIELKEQNPSDAFLSQMDKVKSAIARMSDIITSVMKYARNSKTQTTAYTSLAAATKDVLNILRGYFDKKEILIEVNIPDDVPLVRADAGQIQQILLILAKNAAQALIDHPTRKISFTTRRTGSKIDLIISDTGPGIPEEIQRNIFDAFTTTKPVGIGLGLGLSIAKRLATANSVDIHFHSTSQSGTTFTLTFELEDQLQSEKNQSHTHTKLALVVDDNPNNLLETVQCLEKLKVRVLTASSAREGLNLLSVQKFDFVFCGDKMYPVSGFMFAREAKHFCDGPICVIGNRDQTQVEESTSFLNESNIRYLSRSIYTSKIEDLIFNASK